MLVIGQNYKIATEGITVCTIYTKTLIQVKINSKKEKGRNPRKSNRERIYSHKK